MRQQSAERLLLVFSCLLCVGAVKGYYNTTLIRNITKLLNSLLDSHNYDKNFRPGHGLQAVVVKVDIDVRSMGHISEKDMVNRTEFSFHCYFRQSWVDERLKFVPIGNRTTLMLASKMLRDIWRPDTFIRNGRQSYLHMLTMPNILLRVRSDGLVYISQRLTIRARCPMYFRKFPMDTQACPLTVGSLGYGNRHIVYQWESLAVKEKETSQYHLTDFPRLERNITTKNIQEEEIAILKCYFKFVRQQGYYILQIYIPCTLIVVMSWVSFWINKEASPARVQLGVMTVLSISTLGMGHRVDLPRVSYSTALDLYVVVCFGFVFCALAEYAVINFAHIIYIRKTVQQMRMLGTMLGGTTAHTSDDDEVNAGDDAPPETDDDEEEETARAPNTDDDEPNEVTPPFLTNTADTHNPVMQDSVIVFAGEEDTAVRRRQPLRDKTVRRSTTFAPQIDERPDRQLPNRASWFRCCTNSTGGQGKFALRRMGRFRKSTRVLYRVASKASLARRKLKMEDPSKMVDKIDSISKFLFPFLYCCFFATYWICFLYLIPDEIDQILDREKLNIVINDDLL